MDDPSRLSDTAAAAIEGAGTIGISSVSCWEVAMLSIFGKVSLEPDLGRWIRRALAFEGVQALALGPKAAVDAALLERSGFVADPSDRLIYATARDAGAPLVTRDARIREFDPRGTVW